jgi:hypothetical protein
MLLQDNKRKRFLKHEKKTKKEALDLIRMSFLIDRQEMKLSGN